MGAQEKLIYAIVTKLAADTGTGGVVPLTGHNATNKVFRIAEDQPKKKAANPFLGVNHIVTVPQVVEGPSHVFQSVIELKAYSAADSGLTSTRIADRIETLLHCVSEQQGAGKTNRSFWDVSSSVIGVSNKQTRFGRRSGPDWEEALELWVATVEVSLVWNEK